MSRSHEIETDFSRIVIRAVSGRPPSVQLTVDASGVMLQTQLGFDDAAFLADAFGELGAWSEGPRDPAIELDCWGVEVAGVREGHVLFRSWLDDVRYFDAEWDEAFADRTLITVGWWVRRLAGPRRVDGSFVLPAADLPALAAALRGVSDPPPDNPEA